MRRPEQRHAYRKTLGKIMERNGIPPRSTVPQAQTFTERPAPLENGTAPLPTRRGGFGESFNENKGVYLTLAGLFVFGSLVAAHGVAVGGLIYIIHAIQHYGVSHAALEALAHSDPVIQIATGVGLDAFSLAAMKTTSVLDDINKDKEK